MCSQVAQQVMLRASLKFFCMLMKLKLEAYSSACWYWIHDYQALIFMLFCCLVVLNYGVISFKMNLAGDLTEVQKIGTFRVWTISVKLDQQAEQGMLFPKNKQHLSLC